MTADKLMYPAGGSEPRPIGAEPIDRANDLDRLLA